jgi:DNA-3-methyladenine glycosylase II
MDYTLHLSKDKKIKKLIDQNGIFTLKKQKNICTYLCASIMSQQLSTKVADVIYQRFLNLYGGHEPTPEQVVETAPETLRAIGLSNAKVSYVQNVARFALEHGMEHTRLHKMENEEVIELLTQIKGVGKWTVEMILMFTLGREDVFALDDLGLKQGVTKLYNLKETDKKLLLKKIEKISLKWSPYRTYASRYLWNWKDNPPDL